MLPKPNKLAIVITIVVCAGFGGLLIVTSGYDYNWGRK